MSDMTTQSGNGSQSGSGEQHQSRGLRKVRVGIVSSDRMDKTIVVKVTNLVKHPMYGRIMRRTSKFKAHDETNDCRIGDTVEIMETRPLSKDKRWRVLRVIERAK